MLSTLNFRKPQSAVSTKLLLTPEQRSSLATLPSDAFVLEAWTHHDQQHATEFLAHHTLDRHHVSGPETKWKIISGHSRNSTDKEHVSRLYQCACGCYMAARSDVIGKRRIRQRWAFTSCLAFAEVKVRRDNGEIIKVYGYLEHNDQCKAAQPATLPFPKKKKTVDLQAAMESSAQMLLNLDSLVGASEQFGTTVQAASLDAHDQTELAAVAKTLRDFVLSPSYQQVTANLVAFQQKHSHSPLKRQSSEAQQMASPFAKNGKKQKKAEPQESK